MLEDDDLQAVQKLNEAFRRITDELGKVIVGQQQVIEELLIAMFARGHCLLVGVPGLAKTLLIRTLADTLSLKFSRIQFTPDLMPADITGTEVIQEDKLSGTREFKFLPGPIFANVILADEINRTPPKTQAALLEAMQEHQVTVGGKRHQLRRAVLRAGHAEPDRAGRDLSAARSAARPVHVQHLRRLSGRRRRIRDRQADDGRRRPRSSRRRSRPRRSWPCSRSCARCRWPTTSPATPCSSPGSRAARRATCPTSSTTTSAGAPGRGPASTWCWAPRPGPCCTAATTSAATTSAPSPLPVLRHRIMTNFNAEAEGIKPDDIVRRLIELIPVDDDETAARGKLPEVFGSADAR